MSLYVDIEKNLSSFTLKTKFEQKSGILGFLGESGSGKSMTLKCIAGLENPSKGKIILNDRVLFDSEKNINLNTQERKVGFLFQNYALFPHMNVTQNIELGLSKLPKSTRKEISKEYIKRLCIDGLEDRYPWQLSGGQQQRVALARALAPSPDILLLDEPFSALDYHLRGSMEKELISILNAYKGDVIFVTHDREESYRVCDDILVYDKGISMPKREVHDLFDKPMSYTEAKITGCKNISEIDIFDDNIIYSRDWNIKFKLNKNIDKKIKYIGIRAHYISIVHEESNNTFNLKINNIIENPFSYTLFAKNDNCIKSIQLEVSKNIKPLNIGDNVLVKFEEDKIFLF
ncbi:sulfate/molybdate ABC transporter ATP-binding protein [Romboutsia sp. 1001713B170207_170306_H8]|uniref:sulfate/molybdate ABC transporter ATP-binding protein n=1 Tax=Romboutsia sp. 1001713B170207_170306_H8 TaxID=2787112 RepID=UPI0008208FE5|nr:ATP-binding cassette domain-containing protein [Romboutsia sp. 1001713B170207_170306_H8]SCH72573.1 Fe(3+) ions import ATP-binding protein FbpC 2 [uncultured Clostridium sp.]